MINIKQLRLVRQLDCALMAGNRDFIFFSSMIHSDCLHEAQVIIIPVFPLNLQTHFFSLSLHNYLQEMLNCQIIDFHSQVLGQQLHHIITEVVDPEHCQMIDWCFLYIDDAQLPCLFFVHHKRRNASRWLYGQRRPDADAEIGLIGVPVRAFQLAARQLLTKVDDGVMQLSAAVLTIPSSKMISLLARVILLTIPPQGPEVSAVLPVTRNAEL